MYKSNTDHGYNKQQGNAVKPPYRQAIEPQQRGRTSTNESYQSRNNHGRPQHPQQGTKPWDRNQSYNQKRYEGKGKLAYIAEEDAENDENYDYYNDEDIDEPDQFADGAFNDDEDYDFDNPASANFIDAANYRCNYCKTDFTSNTKLHKHIASNTCQIQHKSMSSNWSVIESANAHNAEALVPPQPSPVNNIVPKRTA